MPCIQMTSSQLDYGVVDQMTLGDGELLTLPLCHGPFQTSPLSTQLIWAIGWENPVTWPELLFPPSQTLL